MRLIDADAIIKEIEERNPDDVSYEDAWAVTCIEHAPTIEERKTGHWILHSEQEKNIFGVKTIECSECGDKCLVQFVEKEKYCRNCGAKMEAENDDIPIEYFESGGK